MTTKSETARTLGRYRLIAVIGQGGMARVYLAVSRGKAGFNKLLVVKELRPDLASDPEFLAMFLDEARLAAKLNHPNVVQTYEVGEDAGSHFIAMEYLEGQALNAVLRQVGADRVGTGVHLQILSTALLGLHYAHELTDFDGTPLEVVHRDVSPQNLFVTYDGQVKIVDFGIAKALGAAARTRAGTIKGKLRYIAPEQAISAPIDRRADLFSFGIMLWEALAQTRFAHGKTDIEMMHQRAMGTEPRIRDVKPDTPEALAKICDRAMSHESAARYATAAELHEDLEKAIEQIYGRITPPQIASLVRDAFVDERTKLRSLVDAQLKLADSVESSDFSALPMLDIGDATMRSDEAGSSPTRGKTPRVVEVDSLQGTAPASIFSKTTASKPKRSLGLFIGVAAAALVIGGLAWSRLGAKSDDSPATSSSVAQPTASPSAATVPPSESTIALELGATPREARIELDGAPLASNPFRATVKRDTALHRVRASSAGFLSDERVVAFDKDLKLELELTAEPDARAAPTSKTPAKPGAPVDAKTGKKPRVIDEKDPYGK